jgi:hypothetical protein
MIPKQIHQQAMDYSFKAKQAFDEGNYSASYNFYIKAAELESKVANFYIKKIELEPTRSVIIRSAAFLCLKAGLIDNAKRFIFIGLLDTKDELIKSQLNYALEISVSLTNQKTSDASFNYNYLNLLRQNSIDYIIEPKDSAYGISVSLQMIHEFTEYYLKSIKAFAISKIIKINEVANEMKDFLSHETEKFINPLITNTSYGSFKFSIANDYIYREGEDDKLLHMKANIVSKFHHEIFINPLNDSDIETLKNIYSEDEINQIFRPLTKIKSNSTPYKIGYYDPERFQKTYLKKIVNSQRRKLLTVKQISKEDIGELESTISHIRSSQDGKLSKKTIFKEELRSYDFIKKTNFIEPKDRPSIILNEEILINVSFSSEIGFKFSFDDINIECTNVEYEKGLIEFYTLLYNKIVNIVNLDAGNAEQLNDFELIKKLIGNIDPFKNDRF